jgi:hypothetical protein
MWNMAVVWLRLTFAIVISLSTATAFSQTSTADNPIVDAQTSALRQTAPPVDAVANDPISAAQVQAAAEAAFPNLTVDIGYAETLRKAADDPSLRGTLRGEIAESLWLERNAKYGWKPVKSPNAPQNDGYRIVNGKLEGAQIKTHADWHDYVRSMLKDNKAEYFVVPDDQIDQVFQEWERRRVGALRGGLAEKAAECVRQEGRLRKFGNTFTEIDRSIDAAIEIECAAVSMPDSGLTAVIIAAAERNGEAAALTVIGGKVASFVGVAVFLLDGGMAVYDVAVGKAQVDELVTRLVKSGVGGLASWAIADAAASAAIGAGATGAVPVAIAIVVGTATYLVIDWSIENIRESIKINSLTNNDMSRLWPEGARGIPLDRLYRRPGNPATMPD